MSNSKRFDPDKHKRIVTDAIGKMKFVQEAKSSMNDPFIRTLDKLAHALVNVRVHINPILKAGGGFDEAALKQIVFTTVRDELWKAFDHDERHMLLTILVCDNVMADIKSNPFGGDKPDLLS